jgi:hypothetical protein
MVAIDALKDPSSLIFRVQKEHEGNRMLTAQEVIRLTAALHQWLRWSSG